MLVLAGAGTGKTRVITYKIAYLIHNDIYNPGRILAVTFTNKAAREMKNRLYNLIGNKSNNVWMGTFHSIALKILRRYGEEIGLLKNFSIIDESDRFSMIRDILKKLNIDYKKFPPKTYLNTISRYKNSVEYLNDKKNDDFYFRFNDVLETYQKNLHDRNQIDFDDMLTKALELFHKNKELLAYYRELFKYILVDEYQDTNIIQSIFLKTLSGIDGNICLVGDDDQAIYSWRGAEVKNILEFEKNFINTKTIKLTNNYRSTQNILNTANKLISNNKFRKGKNLVTEKKDMGKIVLKNLIDEQNEAKFAAQSIKALVKDGISLDNIAILYRVNAQSRNFEMLLSANNIPYKVVGSISFYQRKEIKDILSYLKFYDNPYDVQSFSRSLKYPAKGLGETFINKLFEQVSLNETTIFDELIKMNIPLNIRQKEGVKNYLEIFEKIESQVSIADKIKAIIEGTNYEEYLKQFEEENEANKRIQNIYELINSAILFEESNEDAILSDFLANASLTTATEHQDETSVSLMTIHAAKGLEFDTVILTGMEDGLFPLYRAYENIDEFEEERRLCYVAITRAKKILYITRAESRMLYGKRMNTTPSVFLDELKIDSPKRTYNYIKPDNISSGKFQRGNIVFHEIFGEGNVTDVNGSGKNTKVSVSFKSVGNKKIIARFLKKK